MNEPNELNNQINDLETKLIKLKNLKRKQEFSKCFDTTDNNPLNYLVNDITVSYNYNISYDDIEYMQLVIDFKLFKLFIKYIGNCEDEYNIYSYQINNISILNEIQYPIEHIININDIDNIIDNNDNSDDFDLGEFLKNKNNNKNNIIDTYINNLKEVYVGSLRIKNIQLSFNDFTKFVTKAFIHMNK